MAPAEITDDYYAILGISQTATSDIIKKSYRRLAILLHPDKNPNKPDATASFQLLNRAYETLRDEGSRRIYDLRWPYIRQTNSAAKEKAKRDAEAAQAESDRSAKAKAARDAEMRRSRAIIQGLQKKKQHYEGEIFEIKRVVTKLQSELRNIQALEENALAEERARNSWWRYATSSIFGTHKESEGAKQERDLERLQRCASRTIKEEDLSRRESKLNEWNALLSKVEEEIAVEVSKEHEREMRAEKEREAAKREEEARAWRKRQEELVEQERVRRAAAEAQAAQRREQEAKARKKRQEELEEQERLRRAAAEAQAARRREVEARARKKRQEEFEEQERVRRAAAEAQAARRREEEARARKKRQEEHEEQERVRRATAEAQAARRREEETRAREKRKELEKQQERTKQAAAKAQEAQLQAKLKQLQKEANEKFGKKKIDKQTERTRAARATRSTPSNPPNAFRSPQMSPDPFPSSCRHRYWWIKVEDEGLLCENCLRAQKHFVFQCPECQLRACAGCRDSLKRGGRS